MGERPLAIGAEESDFVAFYDGTLPYVYGYLSSRCGGRALAEDLTAETFLAVVEVVRRADSPDVTLPWVIGVARHKLVDHWRRQAREERRHELMAAAPAISPDPWEVQLDAVRVGQVLATLSAGHRAALTLRYLDDLPVPEIAVLLGRTVHATEALLVRARAAFRRSYSDGEAPDD